MNTVVCTLVQKQSAMILAREDEIQNIVAYSLVISSRACFPCDYLSFY